MPRFWLSHQDKTISIRSDYDLLPNGAPIEIVYDIISACHDPLRFKELGLPEGAVVVDLKFKVTILPKDKSLHELEKDEQGLSGQDPLIIVLSDRGDRKPQSRASQPVRAKFLETAFYEPYLDGNILLNSFINFAYGCHAKWTDQTSRLHAPYFSMFQSNGVGKSRLLIESGNYLYLIYTCFRADDEGYPPRSPIASEFVGRCQDEKQVRINFESFFYASVKLLLEKIRLGWSPVEWLSFQGIRHGQDSSKFRREIMSHFEEYQVLKESFISNCTISSMIYTFFQRTMKELLLEFNSPDILSKYSGVMKEVSMNEDISKVLEDRPFLLFAMDEGVHIAQSLSNEGIPRLRSLMRVMSSFPRTKANIGYSLVVADTSSKILDFTPDVKYQPCSQYSIDFEEYPVFWGIQGWNKVNHKTAQEMVNDLDNPSGNDDFVYKLYKIGRPLWSLLDPDFTPEQQKQFVIQKFLAGDKSFKLSNLSLISILNCLCSINVAPIRSITSELINSKMAVCVGIDDSREVISCQYASEPILVEAMISLLLKHPENPKMLIDKIPEFICSRIIEVEERGRLLTRLAVCCANLSYRNSVNGPNTPIPIPYKLKDFLEHYLDNMKNLEYQKNAMGENFDLLMNGLVFPTHWIRIPPIKHLSQEELLQIFVRGSSIFIADNSSVVDGIILVYLPTLKKVTFVFFQSSNMMNFDRNVPSSNLAALIDQNFNLPYVNVYNSWNQAFPQRETTHIQKTDGWMDSKMILTVTTGREPENFAFSENLKLTETCFDDIQRSARDPLVALKNFNIYTKDMKNYLHETINHIFA